MLTGRVALITGGTGGLGQAVSAAFIREGATVTATFRNEEEFKSLKQELGESFSGFRADVTDETAVNDMVRDILRQHGRIDVLASLVGGYAGGKVAETGLDQLENMYKINLKTAFNSCRAVAPVMIRQNYGKIILVGNIGLLRGQFATVGAYFASKAGVVSLTLTLSQELAAYNINVNCLMPGTMDTPANRRDMPQANFADWAKTEDVARTLLFLASDESAAVKGGLIPAVGKY